MPVCASTGDDASNGPVQARYWQLTACLQGCYGAPTPPPPARTYPGIPLRIFHNSHTVTHTSLCQCPCTHTRGHTRHTQHQPTYFTCLYHHSINFLLTFWSLNSFNPLKDAWGFVCVCLAVVSFSKLPLAANFFFCMALKLIRINSLKQWNGVRKGQQYINSLNIYVLK